MWIAIGLASLVGLFIAIMAMREQSKNATKKRPEPLDEIFDRLDSSIDSLTGTIENASDEEIADLLQGERVTSSTRLTESQLIMLSDAHSYGQLVTMESTDAEGIVVGGPGQMKTVNSLVRRGLLQEFGTGTFRLTPSGDKALFNAHRRN